ncbi:unnamed protein product [Periconia digitata]|uniref:Uncharacterized protein n=1 Tax=Periconia digitata TaxID=1303443 RepID=A0A9W4U7C5_9PLEO|nr:unnamed protein product [Periconia digitata]
MDASCRLVSSLSPPHRLPRLVLNPPPEWHSPAANAFDASLTRIEVGKTGPVQRCSMMRRGRARCGAVPSRGLAERSAQWKGRWWSMDDAPRWAIANRLRHSDPPRSAHHDYCSLQHIIVSCQMRHCGYERRSRIAEAVPPPPMAACEVALVDHTSPMTRCSPIRSAPSSLGNVLPRSRGSTVPGWCARNMFLLLLRLGSSFSRRVSFPVPLPAACLLACLLQPPPPPPPRCEAIHQWQTTPDTLLGSGREQVKNSNALLLLLLLLAGLVHITPRSPHHLADLVALRQYVLCTKYPNIYVPRYTAYISIRYTAVPVIHISTPSVR